MHSLDPCSSRCPHEYFAILNLEPSRGTQNAFKIFEVLLGLDTQIQDSQGAQNALKREIVRALDLES